MRRLDGGLLGDATVFGVLWGTCVAFGSGMKTG